MLFLRIIHSGVVGLDIEQVVTDKLGNTMLSAEEDVGFYDAEMFDHIAHLGAIRLIPRLSCIMKLKLCQMDVKITFINRYLNVEINMDATTDIKNSEVVNLEDNENLVRVHIHVENTIV